jgi:hypothetical protein
VIIVQKKTYPNLGINQIWSTNLQSSFNNFYYKLKSKYQNMSILTLFFSPFSNWKTFKITFIFEFLILGSPIRKRLVGSLIFVLIWGTHFVFFLLIIEGAKAWQVGKVIHRNFMIADSWPQTVICWMRKQLHASICSAAMN